MKSVLCIIFLIFAIHPAKNNNNDLLLNLKKLTQGIQPTTLWNPPTSAIYIDPTNKTDKYANGTINHPYPSFKSIKWTENTVYAIKRGTVLETDVLMVFAHGVTIASYGKGSRPIIKSNTTAHVVSTAWEGSNNVTFRDIEVYAPNATSCIIFRTSSKNGKVINCKLHGAEWGLRALQNIDGLYVFNTEVFNIKDDGMFIKTAKNIEIANCYIHHVNQKWKPPHTPEGKAPGDGIQFEGCNNWHVHHCFIDRSDTGNKFCFISNNPNQNDGIFEYNLLTGPSVEGFSIYIGDGTNLIFRYNTILGPSNSPLFSHANNLQIHHNLFINITGPLFTSKTSEVYNNLFYNVTALALQGGTIIARNNIFEFGSLGANSFKVKNLTEDHNLFRYNFHSSGSNKEKPIYVDVANYNFRPKAGSDAIDKGINVGITHDLDSVKIPQGNAPDIGPYEYIH